MRTGTRWKRISSSTHRPGSAQTSLQQAQLSVQQAQMNYDTLASSLQVKAIGGGLEISMSEENKKMRQHRMSRAEREQTITRLTREMKEAARLLQFEHAAFLRDKIAELRGRRSSFCSFLKVSPFMFDGR